ncbi:hypothetical protein MOC42_16175, partial [Bacillus sonorensis]|nr:hypothetical protein [Bacillus sonorensis]
IASVKGEVGGLKKDMASVKSEVGGLKKDMASVKSEVSGLKQDLSSFKQEFNSFKAETLSHQEHFNSFKNEIFSMFQAIKEAQEKTHAELISFKIKTGEKFKELFKRTAFFDHNLTELTKELAASKRDIEKLKFEA